jgi:ethanolamine utilization protein EutN
MQLAEVVGHAVGTVKHPSFKGAKLLVVQFLAADGGPDGEPVLAVDTMGAARGDRVLVVNDGSELRSVLKAKDTPARWLVMGVCDT